MDISVEPSHLTLHEPVLLTLQIVNDGQDLVQADLGRDRKDGLRIEITRPEGNKIALSWARRSGFSRKGDFEVAAGEKYVQRYVLNELYDFDAVGSYEVETRLAKPILVNGAPLTEQQDFHVTIEIEPRNELALEKRCEAILEEAEDVSSYERAAEGTLALSYVKDPVAVPYLQKLLAPNNLVQPIAIRGLERIATPEAVRALGSLLQTTDKEGSILAKAALVRMETESSDPDVKQEIRRVINDAENPPAKPQASGGASLCVSSTSVPCWVEAALESTSLTLPAISAHLRIPSAGTFCDRQPHFRPHHTAG